MVAVTYIYVHNSAHTSLFSPLECDSECCCGTYWPPDDWNYSRTELWPVSEVYMCTQYTMDCTHVLAFSLWQLLGKLAFTNTHNTLYAFVWSISLFKCVTLTSCCNFSPSCITELQMEQAVLMWLLNNWWHSMSQLLWRSVWINYQSKYMVCMMRDPEQYGEISDIAPPNLTLNLVLEIK